MYCSHEIAENYRVLGCNIQQAVRRERYLIAATCTWNGEGI
jgi:hypothetical protein